MSDSGEQRNLIVEELAAQATRTSRPGLRWRLGVKRLVDIVAAAAGLTLTGPLILLLAWLVKRTSPGPAFFVQERLGRYGKVFRLYKLRTMVEGAEQIGPGLSLLPDDPRITPLGRFLRATSLDELPQLWNVLRGDMSLVGPRPLPVRYLDRFNSRQRMRLLMPQGITGWAQARGRNVVAWPERLEMDVRYVEQWSLLLDARLLLETLWNVLARRGIASSDGSVPELPPQPEEPETAAR
ncbi:MAG: sugar transferase [Armatimonadetes bacterium]|nr:sugar transferase [Armatimonadota bacterium]